MSKTTLERAGGLDMVAQTPADRFFASVLDAAEAHGADSDEPDMEVGDLQGLAHDLWALLTPKQRNTFARNERYHDFVKEWTP